MLSFAFESEDASWHANYDAVVAFEVLEHVREPEETMAVMRSLVASDGRLFVSTPNGAVERGNVPNWDHVERKGHVRALREQDLRAICETVGEVEQLAHGSDGVMAARIKPG